jgi:hypothetical protein
VEAVELNDFCHCLESHERSSSKYTEIKYSVKGRTEDDDTGRFYLIQLECSDTNPWFFDGIDQTNINIKITGTFSKAFDENNLLAGLTDNIFILNEDNLEPNKPDPQYKGTVEQPILRTSCLMRIMEVLDI